MSPYRDDPMKVSIITAVLNGEDSIARTLDSVAAQDHPTIEHIVVDGRSSDGTLSVVRNYPHLEKVISRIDSGVYDAFNTGLREATGDVVVFLNSGDSYISEDIVRVVADLFEDPSLDVVFGDLIMTRSLDDDRHARSYTSYWFSPRSIRWGLMPPHPTMFVRRRVYQEVGGFDASYRIAGDFDMAIKIFLHRRARYRYIRRSMVRMPMGGISNRGVRSLLINSIELHRALSSNFIAASWFRVLCRLPIKWLIGFQGERGR